jgi:hypothetical protein
MDQRTSETKDETAIRETSRRALDVQRFEMRFPPLPKPRHDLPRMTWEHLQRQLTDLSPCTSEEVAALLRPLKEMRGGKPTEMVLRELLIVVSILLEDAPRPDGEGGSTMT